MRIGLTFLIITFYSLAGFSQNAQHNSISSPNSTNASVSQLLSLSQIKLWLRADTLISLNPDSTVSSWNDIVANVTFSATVTQQPTLTVSSLLPGHPSVRFDGVNDGLKSPTTLDFRNQKTTLLMVGKIISPTQYGHMVCYGTNIYGDWNFREVNSTGQISFIHGQTNIGAGYAGTTPTYTAPQFFMFMATTTPGSPGTWEVYENFSLKDVDNSAGYGIGGTHSMTLGYRGDDANSFLANFDMAELIIFDSLIPTTQFDLINSYLVNRYSTKVNLGPDITEPYSFCPKVLSTNIPFQEYVWSNGLTTPTISVNQSGTYYVKTKDKYGLYSSDTIVVTLPGANNPGDSVICPGNTFVWNTQLDNTGYDFLWQDSSNDSLFVINSAGIYSVTIADSFSCTITQSLSVSVDQFATQVSLGPDVSLCAGNTIALVSGANHAVSYLWSTSSTNNSIVVNATGPYSVVVTNTNNCTAKDTIHVTITGFAPTADFSFGLGCKNSAVAFTNLSVPPSVNTITATIWNFGDPASGLPNNSSNLYNPSHTFSDTGNYTIYLQVITDVGCEQSVTKTIHIAPVPTASFVTGLSCQNDSTVFLNQSSGVTGYSVVSSNWNFGDPVSGIANSSVKTSPKHLFSNTGNYTVGLIATNNAGCKDTVYNTVTVKPQVSASFTSSPLCAHTPILFQDNSIAPLPASQFTRTWNFGSGPVNGLTATKTYTSSGVYSVTLTVAGTSPSNLCSSTIVKTFNVFLPPVANFTVPVFCSKDTITLADQSNAQSGIISSYNWRLNNASFSSVQNPTLSLTAATTYSVRQTVVNSFGCKDSILKTVNVLALPNVDFATNPAFYYYINSPVTFTPTIANASAYIWNVTGFPTSMTQSPTLTFDSVGIYTVSLNLTDQQGCKNSKTKTITVSKRYLDLAILNVVTQKDDDGFMTVTADLANYGSVAITTFDMHYQISDAGNIKETWNGTLNPNTFYVYTFMAKSASVQNSTNNITCVEIEKVNSVTDEDISNNTFCNTLNADEISVSNPLPNPAQGDVVLPVTLNRDLDYTIAIYNSIGQIQYDETTKKGTAGLNFVVLPTSSYARGCYIIKTMIDGKTFIKKFIKLNNE